MADHDQTTPDAPGDVSPMARALFGWVEWKWTKPLFFWGLGALTLLLIIIDLAVHRHESVHASEATGFYAIYGFASFAFVVLTGWPLGRLLRRNENYYGDEDVNEEERAQ